METLLRPPEALQAPPEAAPEPRINGFEPVSEPSVERACPICGARLADDQDWCLECGEPARDRVAGVPGWRSAASVLAATLVLASGAVAAAYAALKSDSNKAAATPNAQAALPAQPATPPPTAVTPPPATAPVATPPVIKPPKAVKPPPAVAPKAPAITPPAAVTPPAPAAPAPSVPKSTPKTSTKPSPPPAPAKDAPLAAISLDAKAARTYNPYGHPDTTFTDPANALDGDASTAWTAQIDPNGGSPNVGLVVDLASAQGVRAIELQTPTPGFTLEVYATTGKATPVSIQDPAWKHPATQLDVSRKGRIRISDGTTRYTKLLLWFKDAPQPGATSAAISELQLFG